jgi:kynureninase
MPNPLSCERIRRDIVPRFSRVMSRGEVYLANHSLGRPPDQMAQDVQAGIDVWYSRMDDGWEPWLAELAVWRANVARLIGLSRADAVIPKTSAGQGLRAVLNAFPQGRAVNVITTRGEFDSIDFILKSYAHLKRATVTWIEPSTKEGEVPVFTVEPLIEAMRRAGEPGLVAVSLVFFGTGQILQDAKRLIDEAHALGWLVLLDLYHAVGVIPVDFEALGADFGIGGSYKYLRGGPGACWLAIAPKILDSDRLRSLDTGWFAKKDTFGYARSDTPEFAAGGDGWLESTPPILMPYQAKAGLEFTLEVGVEALREYSLTQQAGMRAAFRSKGVEMFEPRAPTQFGAFSLLPCSDAAEVSRRLKQVGVNTDARGPFVRFGPDLLNTAAEFERAATIVSETLGKL